jgi:hypothetical protein
MRLSSVTIFDNFIVDAQIPLVCVNLESIPLLEEIGSFDQAFEKMLRMDHVSFLAAVLARKALIFIGILNSCWWLQCDAPILVAISSVTSISKRYEH